MVSSEDRYHLTCAVHYIEASLASLARWYADAYHHAKVAQAQRQQIYRGFARFARSLVC